jgi:hypothetical protein
VATKKKPPALVVPPFIEADLERSGLSIAEVSGCIQIFGEEDRDGVRSILPDLDAASTLGVLAFQYHRLLDDGRLEPIPFTEYTRGRIYWKERSGFAAQSAKDDRPKYLQPAKSGVEIFIPPMLDWAAFLQDRDVALLVVEGEKKSLAFATRGVYAIGLGGVNSFNLSRSQRAQHGSLLKLHPTIARLAEGRSVLITYDLDAGHEYYKPAVAAAAINLGDALVDEVPDVAPRIAVLGRPADVTIDQKWAPDDWLVHRGNGPTARSPQEILGDVWTASDVLAASKIFSSFNRQYIHIEESAAIANAGTGFLQPSQEFKNYHKDKTVTVTELFVPRGSVIPASRTIVRPVGDAWLEWTGRRRAVRADYVPWLEPRSVVELEVATFNTFKGWACEPKKGAKWAELDPLRKALFWLHENEEDALRMLHWYMYPLAHPESSKMIQIPVLQSAVEGVGKSIVPSLFAEHIYGVNRPCNAMIMNAAQINTDTRMEYAAERMFILFDDIIDMSPHFQAVLKNLSTSPTLRIDEKYVRSRSVRNLLNCILTTNRTRPQKLTAMDRRMYYPPITERKDHELWKGLAAWFKGPGASIILGCAPLWREKYDGKFDPLAEAPMTEKKAVMVELSGTALDELAVELVQTAAKDVATFREIKDWFMARATSENMPRHEVTPALIATSIKVAGAVLYPKRFIKIAGVAETVYALRNSEKWLMAGPSEWAEAQKSSKALIKAGTAKKY